MRPVNVRHYVARANLAYLNAANRVIEARQEREKAHQ